MSEERPTNVEKAYPPMEYRFTEPADVARYGDRWWTWDEASLIRLPARILIRLEAEIGMPLIDVMNGVRVGSVLGDTAAAWVAVNLVDPQLAGEFDEFDPATLTLQWRKVEPGKADTAEISAAAMDMPAPASDGSPEESPAPPTTSAQAATVTLPAWPVAGSIT